MVEQARLLWRLCLGEELQEERFNVGEASVQASNDAEEAESQMSIQSERQKKTLSGSL